MPRYFFNTHIGDAVITDGQGSEHGDPDAAWEAAHAMIEATMSDPKAQARLMAASLVVTDEAGEVVFEFPFAEAVTLPPRRDSSIH